MKSELSFDSTNSFRKKLLARNLKPFRDDGFNDGSKPGSEDLVLTDLSVIDSEQVEEGEEELRDQILKNLYGPDGQENTPINIDTLTIMGFDETKVRFQSYLILFINLQSICYVDK